MVQMEKLKRGGNTLPGGRWLCKRCDNKGKGTWGGRWENETMRNMQAIEKVLMKGVKKYVRQRGNVNASKKIQ